MDVLLRVESLERLPHLSSVEEWWKCCHIHWSTAAVLSRCLINVSSG